MELYDFITKLEIKTIAANIKDKKQFCFRKSVRGYELAINSAKAATNWNDGTGAGDYIICINFFTKTGGNGGPVSGNKLKELEDEDRLAIHLDNYLKSQRIKGYKGIYEGQLNLFTII